jgi:hypothetical protein
MGCCTSVALSGPVSGRRERNRTARRTREPRPSAVTLTSPVSLLRGALEIRR